MKISSEKLHNAIEDFNNLFGRNPTSFYLGRKEMHDYREMADFFDVTDKYSWATRNLRFFEIRIYPVNNRFSYFGQGIGVNKYFKNNIFKKITDIINKYQHIEKEISLYFGENTTSQLGDVFGVQKPEPGIPLEYNLTFNGSPVIVINRPNHIGVGIKHLLYR